MKNIVYELPRELSNDVRLRILRNYKILGKCQDWVEIEPSALLCSRYKNFVMAVKNYAETVIKFFCSCHNLYDFFTLVDIFCPGL